jgi:murein DD-endopeptidase MepM/ murein hydrolase activator NlpD
VALGLAMSLLAGCGLAAGADADQEASAGPDRSTNQGSPPPSGGTETTVALAELFPVDPPSRLVHEQAWIPFATAGGIVLHQPSSRVERIGFHESAEQDARVLTELATASQPVTLGSRDRPTEARTAADVVVDPSLAIRAPVSGRVLAANAYVLYCQYRDHLVIIEPDEHPGWQVKILHLADTSVRVGQRVEAGVTEIAHGANRFPFASQVDEVTFAPAWPHVHVEIDDPSIPNLPGKGC